LLFLCDYPLPFFKGAQRWGLGLDCHGQRNQFSLNPSSNAIEQFCVSLNVFRIPALILLSVLLALAISACDECRSVKCANGGVCINGDCVCEDGIARPFCTLDTCLEASSCVNGNCEYGFCVCDNDWSGEACDVRIYKNHAGGYFGGYSCNNTYISTATLELSEVNQRDSFEFFETDLNYRYFAIFVTIDSFYVPLQLVRNAQPFVYLSGNGSIREDEINYDVFYETLYTTHTEYTSCAFEGLKR
jgi:hypothetical protein